MVSAHFSVPFGLTSIKMEHPLLQIADQLAWKSLESIVPQGIWGSDSAISSLRCMNYPTAHGIYCELIRPCLRSTEPSKWTRCNGPQTAKIFFFSQWSPRHLLRVTRKLLPWPIMLACGKRTMGYEPTNQRPLGLVATWLSFNAILWGNKESIGTILNLQIMIQARDKHTMFHLQMSAVKHFLCHSVCSVHFGVISTMDLAELH